MFNVWSLSKAVGLKMAIKRLMAAVFAAQDMCHQRGSNKALGNGAAWHPGLHNLLIAGAGQARAFDLIDDIMPVLLENDSLDHFVNSLTIPVLPSHQYQAL